MSIKKINILSLYYLFAASTLCTKFSKSNFKSKLHPRATYIGFIRTCHEIIVTIQATFAYIKIQQKR